MRFKYCPNCGQNLIMKEIGDYINSSYYDKKEMLMLGYKAEVKKADFKISKEVDSVEWGPLTDTLSKLREGSIGWSLVKEVISICM